MLYFQNLCKVHWHRSTIKKNCKAKTDDVSIQNLNLVGDMQQCAEYANFFKAEIKSEYLNVNI